MAIPRQPGSTYRRQSGSAGTLSGARRDLAIQIDGLAEFRRALKAISPDADKEFRTELRKYGKRALTKARGNAPVQTGALRKSIKLSVTTKEASLYSNSPYARAHEWGTSNQSSSQVQPRGVPIKIERSQMLGNAVYFYRNALGYSLANLVDKTAKKHGIESTPTVRQSRYGGGRIIGPS